MYYIIQCDINAANLSQQTPSTLAAQRLSTQHFHILTFFWQSSHLGNGRICPLSWSITEWIGHTVYWRSEAPLLWKRSIKGLWPSEKSSTITSIFPMKPFPPKSLTSFSGFQTLHNPIMICDTFWESFQNSHGRIWDETVVKTEESVCAAVWENYTLQWMYWRYNRTIF